MSHIAILSVNHAQAPVSVRERVAFAPNDLSRELQVLNSIPDVEAGVILSTCNRSEIYAVINADNAQEILSQYLADTHQISREEIDAYLVYFEDNAALEHICNVACGLDSLVLGEPQILGQLKDAYHSAKQAKTLDKKLEKLFQHAFSTAKKVRTDTQIGSSPVSIAYCAVKLSEKIFTDLSEQTVLLIGAGEMIELCAQHLNQKGVKNIIVANRTLENAQKIASLYKADVYLYTIDDLEQVVSDNIDSREKEKVLAQEIIIKQTQVFNKWLSVLPNEQLVQTYRHSVNQIKEEALTDALKRLSNGGDSEQIMTKLADQLANKILHTTFKNIKQTPREALSQCEGCIPNLKK